ncbi:transmembrane and coiled-coil domain-containing protein 6 isoform X2 [Ornithorhynchus anatinus]|uniref:transmembrane and coiled-coil domain-containing protein 6 isoform X2 n=1 Tax=Ornithorhynchus anatinus TaxID=9258 RepID=UPI0010A9309D|nr:transmembrane and coiled-coil domain-containing protein 6 isoform X2 [Ornithorhynchus anatinus]
MWSRRAGRLGPRGAEELRGRRREREAALRKVRRQQQLVSKRLLREDAPGAAAPPEPLESQEMQRLLRAAQRGTGEKEKEAALGSLRRGLQHPQSQRTFIRMEGGIRALVGLLTSSRAGLRLEAARCLHELSHADDPAVAEACLPSTSYLLTYLSGHSADFVELCLYTLGNLAVDSEAVRKQLLPQGVISAMAACVQSPHPAVLEALGYALSQLLQAKEASDQIIPRVLASPLLRHVLRLLRPTPEWGPGVAVEFAWCLHYIVCSQVDNPLLISRGALSALAELLPELAGAVSEAPDTGLELLACPVLRSLGNLLAEESAPAAPGWERLRDERILVAVFVLVRAFLRCRPGLVPECLWLLNNLTADDPALCTALLTLDLIAPLLQLLPSSQEALTVLCNVAEKGPLYCQRLWPGPTLPSLLATLALSDPEVVGQSLELLQLLFLHWPEAAHDFLQQSGLRALEQHEGHTELRDRVRALKETALRGSRPPPTSCDPTPPPPLPAL